MLDAAVAFLRETARSYGLVFDGQLEKLAKKSLTTLGFTTRKEVIRFYEEPHQALRAIVKATCAYHEEKIMVDLAAQAAVSRELREPSRYRTEGKKARDDRYEAQKAAADQVEALSKGGSSGGADALPADQLRSIVHGTTLEDAASHGQSMVRSSPESREGAPRERASCACVPRRGAWVVDCSVTPCAWRVHRRTATFSLPPNTSAISRLYGRSCAPCSRLRTRRMR